MSCGTKVPLLPLISSTFITVNLFHIIRMYYFFYCRLLVQFHRSSLLCHCRHRLWDFAACAPRARAGAPAAAILYCSTPLFSVGRAFGGSSGGQGSMGRRLKASAAVQCALAAV